MSYPPQQPENGWSDQQEPVDPFAPGNAVPPAAPQADAYGQQPPQHPEQPGQPVYQAQPPVYYPEQQPGYPPSDQTQALPPRAPADPNAQQYYQAADPNAQQYYQPADPNAQQYYQPADPNAQAPVDPNAQHYYQPAEPDTASQQNYPQAQPLPDPFAPQQVEQPFPQAPVSASPTSAQPASGQPFSGQPFSGQPFAAATPPGVPESPFAAAPSHNAGNLPTPVSASPTSGQPWASTPPPVMPHFTPRKPRRGLPGWVYVVGVIVIVAALAVGGVVWLGSGSPGGDDKPTGQASASKSEQPDPKEDEVKLVTDKESGLAFQTMPDPWQVLDANELPGAVSATGQVLNSDKGVSGYFAACQLKTKDVKYANTDVVDAGKEWAALIDKSQWVDEKGKQLKGVERTAPPKFYNFRVDGHKAYFMTYKLTWKSGKVAEKGAEVTIGVIDKNGKDAAGFLAIMPESLSEKHKPAIKDTMLTLRFED